eukprot:1415109-Rhodomonas_salina.1
MPAQSIACASRSLPASTALAKHTYKAAQPVLARLDTRHCHVEKTPEKVVLEAFAEHLFARCPPTRARKCQRRQHKWQCSQHKPQQKPYRCRHKWEHSQHKQQRCQHKRSRRADLIRTGLGWVGSGRSARTETLPAPPSPAVRPRACSRRRSQLRGWTSRAR